MLVALALAFAAVVLALLFAYRQRLTPTVQRWPLALLAVGLALGAVGGVVAVRAAAAGKVHAVEAEVTALSPSGDSICLQMTGSWLNSSVAFLRGEPLGSTCALLGPNLDLPESVVGQQVHAAIATYTPPRGAGDSVIIYLEPAE